MQHYDPEDTIVAVASAPGGAARGIVRISGQHMSQCLAACWKGTQQLEQVGQVGCLAGALALDGWASNVEAELLWWPHQRSYTRQPLAEIHTFGSPPLLQAVVRTLCRQGARVAEPGEFTLRAFLAGRVDLTQAEAVLGVIDSTNSQELETALHQLAGGLRGSLTQLREQLLDLLAHLEAGLDFVDEDIEFISAADLTAQLTHASHLLSPLAQQLTDRSVVSDAFRVVLTGSPNVGKSSLFNALCHHSTTALVSDIPGTTRDWISARLPDMDFPCEIIDTAGAELAAGGISQAAQMQKDEQLSQAQLIMLCLDSTRPLTDWEQQELAASVSIPRLVILTKTDRPPATDFVGHALFTSSSTGLGLDQLRAAISTYHQALRGESVGAVSSTAVRCAESIRLAVSSLQRAVELAQFGHREELVAAEVRVTLTELGKIVGAVYTDDILDRIFSRFCIGK